MGFSRRNVLLAAEILLKSEPAYWLDNVREAMEAFPADSDIHICDVTIALRNLLPSATVAFILRRLLDPVFVATCFFSQLSSEGPTGAVVRAY